MKTILIFLNAGNAVFSWQDVIFAVIICLTIFGIVCVLSCRYYKWKKEESTTKKTTAYDLHKHEIDVIKTRRKIELEKEIINYLTGLANILEHGGDAEAYKAAHKEHISRVETYWEFYADKNTKETPGEK